jgi:hypothetical protein
MGDNSCALDLEKGNAIVEGQKVIPEIAATLPKLKLFGGFLVLLRSFSRHLNKFEAHG